MISATNPKPKILVVDDEVAIRSNLSPLRELVEETVTLVQEYSEQDLRQISLLLPPPSQATLAVLGDSDLLLVAVHNLLDNAFEFSRPEILLF